MFTCFVNSILNLHLVTVRLRSNFCAILIKNCKCLLTLEGCFLNGPRRQSPVTYEALYKSRVCAASCLHFVSTKQKPEFFMWSLLPKWRRIVWAVGERGTAELRWQVFILIPRIAIIIIIIIAVVVFVPRMERWLIPFKIIFFFFPH